MTTQRSLLGRVAQSLVAWAAAVGLTYILAAAFSQATVMGQLYAIGVDVPILQAARSVGEAVLRMFGLLPIIAIAFAVGFPVAAVLKRTTRPLAPIAYLVAGGAAYWAVLELMRALLGLYPILGAQTLVGFALQILAGLAGGVAFGALIAGERHNAQ